jgi:hypothetical protein
MSAANHGHHVGGVKDMLFVNRVRGGLDPGVRIVRDKLDGWKIVSFGELPAELRGIALSECKIGVEVPLIGVAETRLVNELRINRPNIRNLRVIVVDVSALALDRSLCWIEAVTRLRGLMS